MALGLSALAAAGLGNLISDVIGIQASTDSPNPNPRPSPTPSPNQSRVARDTQLSVYQASTGIDALATRLGLPSSGLSAAQLTARTARGVTMLASMLGTRLDSSPRPDSDPNPNPYPKPG